MPAANNADGSPAWMIQDPTINQFYRITWLDFEIMSRWHLNDIATIVDSVNTETTLSIDEESVTELVEFLAQQHLVQASSSAQVDELIKKAGGKQQNIFSWLLHRYLFFRIPLIRPQVVLAKLMPFLKWIFTIQTAVVVLGITLTGLFFAARQWDTFSATFIDQLTIAGIVSYAVALLFSKCLHELGHAITATKYGVRVGHMGIALLVMFPMPYTDTSESWKLSNNKQRLHIAAAGIIVELALAGIATLAWSLSPEGAIKSALFFLATTSWVLTLIVNLSPFLRFDGYFILSDILDFPNLHERAGAFGKTFLRRNLLGFEDDWPEVFSNKKRRALIIFSGMTWLYRMIVFIGIAWLVYYFFFKVLGVILFLVEIWWFIVLPNLREIKVWFMRRNEIKRNRIIGGTALLAGLIALGLLPWQTSVETNGWIHATAQHTIYTPTAGKLSVMRSAGPVQKGEKLFTLTSPDIALNALRSQALAEARASELRGLSGLDDGEARRKGLQLQQEQFKAEVKLYKDELDRMDLTAPFDGVLLDLDENLSKNTWIHTEQALAIVIDPDSWAADAFVPEKEIKRIKVGDSSKVYLLDNDLHIIEGEVIAIDKSKTNKLPHKMLDAMHGGNIATLPNDESIPTQAHYKVRIAFNPEDRQQFSRISQAKIDIETEAKAWLPSLFERIAATFIRESGF